jgi:hypothetical protein
MWRGLRAARLEHMAALRIDVCENDLAIIARRRKTIDVLRQIAGS